MIRSTLLTRFNLAVGRIIDSQITRSLRTTRLPTKPISKKSEKIPNFEKRLDVVIMGSPNAGKSVLLNQLVNDKLSATSRKRHTTKREILGVSNHDHTQLAFYDTPGFETPFSKSQANRKYSVELSKIAVETTHKADIVMLVVDGYKRIDDRVMIEFSAMAKVALENAKKEIILVINKVDIISPKSQLLDITRKYVSLINGVRLGANKEQEAELDTTTFLISGLKNDGISDMKAYLLDAAEVNPWIVPASGGKTLLSNEERVEQIVLESMLDHTHDEIPYVADIRCTKIESYSAMRLKVYVDISVETARQQKMCVGQQGRTMLKIRQKSTEYLEKILKKQVLVYLNIIVRGEKKSYRVDEVDSITRIDEESNEDEDNEMILKSLS